MRLDVSKVKNAVFLLFGGLCAARAVSLNAMAQCYICQSDGNCHYTYGGEAGWSYCCDPYNNWPGCGTVTSCGAYGGTCVVYP